MRGGWWVYLLRDELCLSESKDSEEVEKSGAAVLVERLLATALDELFSAERLAPFVACVKERMSANSVLLIRADAQMVTVKSRLTSAWFSCSVNDFTGASNVLYSERGGRMYTA